MTNAVVVETYSVLLARARNGRQAAISFLDAVTADDGEIVVERIQTGDEERAFALVRDHQDKSYSLCDALSFVVMERLGITDAIAFDEHFREYGRLTDPRICLDNVANQRHSGRMVPSGVDLDPVTLSLLNAPVDDESLTEEDLSDIAASEEDIRCGRVYTIEQVCEMLGIDLHNGNLAETANRDVITTR